MADLSLNMSHPNKNDLTNYFFCEDFYPPVSQDYGYRCSVGLKKALLSDVFIVGVVRDASFILERNLACIDHIRSLFKSSRSFFFENDSKDSTKNILDKYCDGSYSILKSENLKTRKLSDTSSERRENMAYARNQYVNFLESIHLGLNSIVLVVDLDLYGWSYTGLLNSLSYIDDTSCFGSNSIVYRDSERLFYDTWAYKDSYNLSEEEKNLLRFNRGENPFEVDSCFGGLAIYPASVFSHNIKYKSYDCDHVTFHDQLKKFGYKIYLNPSQITLYSKHYYI